ncbi:MAG: RyR domain-containing protein [Promethearchaeota archaeon]
MKHPITLPNDLIDKLLRKVPKKVIDGIAELVHDAWWQEKINQGYHHPSEKHKEWDPHNPKKFCEKCHLDMIPYAELPDNEKIYDIIMVKTILAALRLQGYHVHPNPKFRKFDIEKWTKDFKTQKSN